MAEKVEQIVVPEIGDAKNVDVIEVNVKVGDLIEQDQPMITLEGDKATMEIPAPMAGTVESVQVKVGDQVSAGSLILKSRTESVAVVNNQHSSEQSSAVIEHAPSQKTASKIEPTILENLPVVSVEVHAGPAVRRIANELGLDLKTIQGTGDKGRITKDDLKRELTKGSALSMGLRVAETVSIDFSKFGLTETQPLSKIKKISGANLHRNWVTIPHVTQFDEADITELENFRKESQSSAEKAGVKLTPLVFILKAVVKSLQAFPAFNASLDSTGEQLILKKYFNIGVAVDTPNGLVVPVIRHVDQKTIFELARELALISQKAREKGLSMNDMQGGCFSISSLGGIGGTAFTPIINAPEVAILGVSKSTLKPIYQKGEFVPRLMLPLSLSYDHRVIDGAEAARFITHLSAQLTDIRRILL